MDARTLGKRGGGWLGDQPEPSDALLEKNHDGQNMATGIDTMNRTKK